MPLERPITVNPVAGALGVEIEGGGRLARPLSMTTASIAPRWRTDQGYRVAICGGRANGREERVNEIIPEGRWRSALSSSKRILDRTQEPPMEWRSSARCPTREQPRVLRRQRAYHRAGAPR